MTISTVVKTRGSSATYSSIQYIYLGAKNLLPLDQPDLQFHMVWMLLKIGVPRNHSCFPLQSKEFCMIRGHDRIGKPPSHFCIWIPNEERRAPHLRCGIDRGTAKEDLCADINGYLARPRQNVPASRPKHTPQEESIYT